MPAPPCSAADWCAWAWRELGDGRPDRAEAGFRQALALEPGALAGRFGLASVLLDRGDVQGADDLVGQVAMADAAPALLWLRARIAAARGDPGAARPSLERLLSDTRVDDRQRADALLLLGIVLGDLGEPAAAFAAAREGKSIQRALHAAQAASREGEVAKLRRLTAWIGTEPTPWKSPLVVPQPGAAATHVFLLGFPRSGTTLLEQVLATHPPVATLEEAPTLAAAYQAFLVDADACAALMRLSAPEAAAWVAHYWAGIRQRGLDVDGRVFVDKQPAGTLWLPVIARLFPDAKILFARRDPRDVVLSCYRQSFQINAMTYAFTDLAETAACYDACMTLAEQARGRLPLAWREVRHEALVENFDAEIAPILDFLHLEADAGVADFATRAASRTIRTPSATQVRAGLNRRGLGRWTHYRDELAPVLPALARWVERLGYPD